MKTKGINRPWQHLTMIILCLSDFHQILLWTDNINNVDVCREKTTNTIFSESCRFCQVWTCPYWSGQRVRLADLPGSGISYSKTETLQTDLASRYLMLLDARWMGYKKIVASMCTTCSLTCCFCVFTFILWVTLLAFSKKKKYIVFNKLHLRTFLGNCYIQYVLSEHQDLHRHLISVCSCSTKQKDHVS